jgi:hypothetical protein
LATRTLDGPVLQYAPVAITRFQPK